MATRKFSKKHYEALAQVLREAESRAEGICDYLDGIEYVRSQLIILLSDDSDQFDVERFNKASRYPEPSERSSDSGHMNDVRFGGTLDETGE